MSDQDVGPCVRRGCSPSRRASFLSQMEGDCHAGQRDNHAVLNEGSRVNDMIYSPYSSKFLRVSGRERRFSSKKE